MKTTFLLLALMIAAASARADEVNIQDLLGKYQSLENGKLGDQFGLRKSIGGPGNIAPLTYDTPSNSINSFMLSGANVKEVTINPETGLVRYKLQTSYADIARTRQGRDSYGKWDTIKAPPGEEVERFMYIQDPEKRIFNENILKNNDPAKRLGKVDWSKVDVSKMPGLWYQGETQGERNFVLDLAKRVKAWRSGAAGSTVAKGLKNIKGKAGKAGVVGAAAAAATIGYEAVAGEGAHADELKPEDLKHQNGAAKEERTDAEIGTLGE